MAQSAAAEEGKTAGRASAASAGPEFAGSGTAPDERENPGQPRSEGSSSGPLRSTRQSVTTLAQSAKVFVREVVGRTFLIFVAMLLVGFLIGSLLNWGAWHLLDKADALPWAQPWNQTRARDLGDPLLNNQTYVQVYHPKHREADYEPDAPKFAAHWVYIFYLRGAVAQSIGYGTPWFIMCALHGIATVRKLMALLYTPLVVLLVVYALGSAATVVSTGAPLLPPWAEIGVLGLVSLLQGFVVMPLVARRLELQHQWKVVIFPFVLLNIGLFGLKFIVPLMVVGLSDWAKVAFRLTVYAAAQEIFVASARILQRMVPLADEGQYRPEDKVFAVLPLDCLFGYWGRIILMDMTDRWAILTANLGNFLLELGARVTVVHRDRFYLAAALCSFEKRGSWWSTNAKGMMRLRCSMIISHLLLEYLMIASAASFYWFSGVAGSLSGHLYNVGVQLGSEVLVDSMTLYVEIVKHKLPIINAWFQRQKHYGFIFALFCVGFTLFAVSQAAGYFCAMRKPDDHEWVMLVYCGADK